MVIVKLQGGLGNQMFQYAAARRLAVVNGATLKLDISSFTNDYLRSYNLFPFNIEERFVSPKELAFVVRLLSYRRRISQSIPAMELLLKRFYPWNIIYEDHVYAVNTKVMNASGHMYLDGYWQSEKYFKDIQDIIKNDFTYKSSIQPYSQEIVELITSNQSVSIHVRRGDYVSNSSINQVHGICGAEYYQRAIDLIAKKIFSPHFFVFSDDITWCKQYLKLDYPVTFVSQTYSNGDHEDMRLMSLCHHQIIANSTFSWWAAWLNNNPDKIVVAPQYWFRESDKSTDLLPDSWLRL